jgi:hypothetical protein
MANAKISALTGATTPLAGTEEVPVVQGGATRKVSVANLTTGRALSATELTLTTGNLIVSSGKGIDFSATPGTGTSELLADYEEGTWTPTLSFVSSQTGSFTYTTQYGRYFKISNRAIVQFTINCSAVPSVGDILVLNSPFTVVSASGVQAAVSSIGGLTFTSINLGAGGTQAVVTAYGGGFAIGIVGSGRAYTDVVAASSLASGFNISGFGIIEL